MRIIKKLRINFCNGDIVRRFYIFGKPVVEYKKTGHKRKWQLYHMPKPYKGQRVFYLKINRIHQTSFDCIQQWMDIVEKMDGFCYFVCDTNKWNIMYSQSHVGFIIKNLLLSRATEKLYVQN